MDSGSIERWQAAQLREAVRPHGRLSVPSSGTDDAGRVQPGVQRDARAVRGPGVRGWRAETEAVSAD